MAYDPTTPADPFDPATDVVKCYVNYPTRLGPPLAGHRVTQNVGRQIQVTGDNQTDATYTPMIKHPK
jgi:hypothetical protein